MSSILRISARARSNSHRATAPSCSSPTHTSPPLIARTHGRSLSTPPTSPTAHTSRIRRSISTTNPTSKALPFGLNTYGAARTDRENDGPVLRMLMFGKPGAGKGTLSARLVKKYDISFLSAGDMLRREISERTEVGRIADEIVAHGGLLPDDIMLRVITSRLDALRNKHWILDGFPRTLGQGELLDSHMRGNGSSLTLIVNLDVPDDVILSRISDRWVHLPSGRVYNLSFNAPQIEGRDDETGEPLTKRPDDNPEIFSRRLKAFYESTSPLLSYYASRNTGSSASTKMVTLSGRTSDEIWPMLDNVVQQHFRIKLRVSQSSVREAVMMRGAASSGASASAGGSSATRTAPLAGNMRRGTES